MSSTTDRSGVRGQTLPLFALAVVVLLGIAALAFDGGQMLLDRRTEQDAADAAALAGARYIVTDPSAAAIEALRLAYQNGYGAGTTGYTTSIGSSGNTVTTSIGQGNTVVVQVPPGSESKFAGQSGYIEVQINSSRPSIFGGVIGFITQHTGALGTASNQNGAAVNYSMLALNRTECPSAKFSGTGTITVSGSIQVDSSCTHNPDAFDQGGSTSVTVTGGGEIDVVGSYNCATLKCVPTPKPGQPYVPDPLLSLPAPALPSLPADVMQIPGVTMDVPDHCPGGTSPATALAPATCSFTSSYAGTTWLLSPGYYPGGISIQGGTIFMRPGVYYIGGGGLNAAGTGANLYTVSSTWSSTTAPTCTTDDFADCGGVLIYNTNDPTATSGGSTVTNKQPIALNGANSIIHLYGIQDAGPYTNIVIFEDRDPTLGSSSSGDLQLNGNGAQLYVQGTIYMPVGYVAVEGTGDLGPTQIIADTFAIKGNGNLSIDYNQDLVAQLIAIGLVE